MNKYIIWVDILGFEALLQGIAPRFPRPAGPSLIRERLLFKPLKEAIEKSPFQILDEGTDHFVLLADDKPTNIFSYIDLLSTVPLEFENYPYLPVEIAIGKIFMAESGNPINQDEAIAFLKSNIIGAFRKEQKDSIKQTFVLITNDVYRELVPRHANKCDSHQDGNFHSIPIDVIEIEKKVSNFLEEMGQETKGDMAGAIIHDIFIPPNDFDRLKQDLHKDRVVFIAGTPGTGKRYTAIRLLWEKYCEGYTPIWDRGDDAQRCLAELECASESKKIIFLEDPFGEKTYAMTNELEERIPAILDSVRTSANCYLVITLTMDIFDNFLCSGTGLGESKPLNFCEFCDSSYSIEKRREALTQWAEEKRCSWLDTEETKQMVFEELRRGQLQTLFRIHEFCHASHSTKDNNLLQGMITEYSQRDVQVIVSDIKTYWNSGRKDKVLLLLVANAAEGLVVDVTRDIYHSLKQPEDEGFYDLIGKERRLKIRKRSIRGPVIEIAHPHYREAINKVFHDVDELKKVYGDVLIELNSNPGTAEKVALALKNNFSILPTRISCKLLVKLASDTRSTETLAMWYSTQTLADNFEKVPEDNRREILDRLSDNNDIAGPLALAVIGNAETLNNEAANKLLEHLSNNPEACAAITWAAVTNFELTDERVKSLLGAEPPKKTVEAWLAAGAVARLWENFEEEDKCKILDAIAEDSPNIGKIAVAVSRRYSDIPDATKSFLLGMAQTDFKAKEVGIKVTKNLGDISFVLDQFPQLIVPLVTE